MDFDKALITLEIGSRVAVSNGQQEPADEQGKRNWRTNNFEGTVVALDAAGIQVELDEVPGSGAVVAFVVEPGRGHTFFNLTPSLPEMQERRIEELKALRDQHEFGTLTIPGVGVLQIDEMSQGRMHRTKELGRTYEAATGNVFTTAWRMFDNTWVPVNLQVLDGWSMLIGAQVQHVFSHFGQIYDQVMAATSAEELDAIDSQSGWDMGAL